MSVSIGMPIREPLPPVMASQLPMTPMMVASTAKVPMLADIPDRRINGTPTTKATLDAARPPMIAPGMDGI